MEDNIRTEVINAIIDGQSDYAGELIEHINRNIYINIVLVKNMILIH